MRSRVRPSVSGDDSHAAERPPPFCGREYCFRDIHRHGIVCYSVSHQKCVWCPFLSEAHSRSHEWRKRGSENGGTPHLVAPVTKDYDEAWPKEGSGVSIT